MNATTLVFQNTTFDIVDRSGDAWLRGYQIGTALGYSNQPDTAVRKIVDRHADEFTDDMTALVKLPTEGGEQETRIFSPRGCYALAMFSRAPVAKEFRRWVLDVLESIRKTGKYEAAPYAVNPGDSLSKDEAGTLRAMLTDACAKLTKERQKAFMLTGWSKLKSHFKTGYRQIPRGEFTEALSIVARHVAEGEYLPRQALTADDAMLAAASAEIIRTGRRFMAVFYRDKTTGEPMPVLTAIPRDACIMNASEIIDYAKEPGGFPVALIPALIQAAASRLNHRLA